MDLYSKLNRNDKKFKILICQKTKQGQLTCRRPVSFTKALAWLRNQGIGTFIVRCTYGWGQNVGEFMDITSAIHFLRNNWEDFQIWKEEK